MGFETGRPTVREAARKRMPLDGPDAQALEGALQQVERDLIAARRRVDSAENLIELLVSAADAMPYAQHYGHFDREGNAGRTCPACIDERRQRDVVRERIKIARSYLASART